MDDQGHPPKNANKLSFLIQIKKLIEQIQYRDSLLIQTALSMDEYVAICFILRRNICTEDKRKESRTTL